ncbi:MAG: hypothetical protein ACRCWQ_01870 [Bacilli bacterium]
MDWLMLVAPHIAENYTTTTFDDTHIQRLRLGEELLSDASFSKTRIIDRLYLLQNAKNKTDKIMIHLEFESSISGTDFQKWRDYFCRIQGNVTHLPIYHILVFVPGISGVPRLSWEEYTASLFLPNETYFYYPLYMDEYQEEHLSTEMRSLWRAIHLALSQKVRQEKDDSEVYISALRSILAVYQDKPFIREVKPLVSALSYLFKLPLTSLDQLLHGFVGTDGGESITMYQAIRGEEREQMLKEMREELYPIMRKELYPIIREELYPIIQAEMDKKYKETIDNLLLRIEKLERK